MKHLSVRPAAAKLMISCEAFVAAAVLGVVLFLNFYHSYNDGILYSERLNQMKEVTTQLFEGLNDVLELRWADARSHTNPANEKRHSYLAGTLPIHKGAGRSL